MINNNQYASRIYTVITTVCWELKLVSLTVVLETIFVFLGSFFTLLELKVFVVELCFPLILIVLLSIRSNLGYFLYFCIIIW